MSHTPHELAEDFPHDRDKIHQLKTTDSHFARLMEAYHDVNRAVHRAETGMDAVDDFTQQKMRKDRMALKDQIAAILSKA